MENFKKSIVLPHWVAIALALIMILGLQLAMVLHKLELPFLDGQMHYNFDNSLFTFFARNGIRLNELKTLFGITDVPYTAWGKPSGTPTFYAHHPFLFKALFQQYVRVFGDAEWVSRSFALGVAAIAATGIFTGLFVASESVLAAFLGTAVLVGIPVFAIFQSCIKYEIDGMAAGSWFFVAMALYLRRPSRTRLAALTILAALSSLAHWTSLLLVVAIGAWLAWEWARTRDQGAGRAAFAAVLGAVTGTTAVVATFAWLKGGWGPFLTDIFEAAASRASLTDLPAGVWGQRQANYLAMNFGKLLPWVAGLLTTGLTARWGWNRLAGKPRTYGRAAERLLPAFFFCTLAVACIWQFTFKQGSFAHSYWQLWFCLPVAGLVTMGISLARTSGRTLAVAMALAVALAGWLQVSSYASYRDMVAGQRGIPSDLELLKSLRGDTFSHFVFIPVEQHHLNDWFQGPVFEYYTDRKVVTYDGKVPLATGDKALVLLYQDQDRLVAEMSEFFNAEFTNAKCGPRFCVYDVVKR